MKNEYPIDREEIAFQIRQVRNTAVIFAVIFTSGFLFGVLFAALVF